MRLVFYAAAGKDLAGEQEGFFPSAVFFDYPACSEYCLYGHRNGDNSSVCGILKRNIKIINIWHFSVEVHYLLILIYCMAVVGRGLA